MHEYLNEHQKTAVYALEELDRICKKYDINYYLLAGSALGAVRHEGMIPWDDDIDVGLVYKEWIRLKKILPEEIKSPYEYCDYDQDKTFPRMFGKILCDKRSCIDLFLLAKWTDRNLSARIHWQIMRIATNFYLFSLHKKYAGKPGMSFLKKSRRMIFEGLRRFLYLLIRPFFGRDDFIRLAKWNEAFFETRPWDCYINLYSVYSMEKEKIRREWVEKTATVTFEGKKYTSFGDLNAYLTHLYGDYMTPPAEKDRVATHEERF